MRVLHVGKYYPPYQGGIENYFKDLLHALSKDGITICGLVHHHISGKALSIERDGDLTIVRVPLLGRVLYTPISPLFPREMIRAVRSFQPHLIHFHLPNPSVFWGLLIPQVRSIPWVIRWHSDVVLSVIDRRLPLAYMGYRPFEQAFLKHAKRILPTSQSYLDASHALSRWSSKCSVVPLGLDPNRLPWPEELAISQAERNWGNEARLRVLAVGRLTYYKGFDVLVRAAVLVPDVCIQIVGEGTLKEELEKEVIQNGLGGRLRLRGSLSNSELQALFATCHCLCLPSVERTEAFGVVLLEAMRYGRAVVASDIPGSGVGWVAGKGSHGMLFKPGNARALAEVLKYLIAQPTLCREMGERGKEKFRRSYDIKSISRQIKDIYFDLV